MSFEARARFYDRAANLTPFLATTAGSAVYLVRTEDRHIGRSLFAKEGRGEMHVLARAVTLVVGTAGPEAVEGTQFLDVGANIGTTTIPALVDHPFASAVAFEPEPMNLLTLRLNLLLNHVADRGTAMGVAISNRNGSSDLVVDRSQGGKHWVATDTVKSERARRKRGKVISVETVTLDQLADDGTIAEERVGLIWIDAQAHEGHILEGASRLMKRGVPVVLEWDPKGLDRVGDRGKLQDVVADHYSHFVDLRQNPDPTEPRFEVRSTDALGAYATRFLDPEMEPRFTDIMVMRLGQQQAASLDVPALLRENRRARVQLPPTIKKLVATLDERDDNKARRKAKSKRAAARRA